MYPMNPKNSGGSTLPPPKPAEPNDPFQLTPASAAGDASFMLDAIIEEFAAQGWPASRIESLFKDQFYTTTASLCTRFGLPDVQRRIAEAVARRSAVRTRVNEIPPGPGSHPTPFAV